MDSPDTFPSLQEHRLCCHCSLCCSRGHDLLLNDNPLVRHQWNSILNRRSHNRLAVLCCGWRSSPRKVLNGVALSYIPKAKYQTIVASCLAFAFVTSLSSISQMYHAAFIVLGVFACPLISFVDNITFPGVTLAVEPQDIGLASGVLGSIRACGGVVAQGIYVSVLLNKLAVSLPKFVSPTVLLVGLPSSSLPALFAGITTGNFSVVPSINAKIIQAVELHATRRTVHLQLQNRVLCDDSLECFIDLGSLLCAEYGAVFGEQSREEVAEFPWE